MKKIFFTIMVMSAAQFITVAAHAGGGDWAPSVVCQTSDQQMTLDWSYEQLGESLVGRQFGIQLPGEDEGLPYLVTADSGGNLTLQARVGWTDPGTVFPLGNSLTMKLARDWKSAKILAKTGATYELNCKNYTDHE